MAVYAAEVTAEESDMANDAEPDMDETPETDNASETDKEDKTDVQDMEQNVPVTDIEISDHEEKVEVGKTINLTATALPANATESTITFRSSDINIATVTSGGEVKGISKGYVTIYVSAGSIIKEERIIMEQDKRVEDKKVRFILLITQVVLWFMVMVMEMVVLIVKQINVSEHMLFLVSINLITIVTILINVHNYRKNKKRM